ncbi:MAG: hypothetical protein WA740_14810 [Candidatus Binataceae bacterium]
MGLFGKFNGYFAFVLRLSFTLPSWAADGCRPFEIAHLGRQRFAWVTHRTAIFADHGIEHKAELFSLIISLEMWDQGVPINRVKRDLYCSGAEFPLPKNSDWERDNQEAGAA